MLTVLPFSVPSSYHAGPRRIKEVAQDVGAVISILSDSDENVNCSRSYNRVDRPRLEGFTGQTAREAASNGWRADSRERVPGGFPPVLFAGRCSPPN